MENFSVFTPDSPVESVQLGTEGRTFVTFSLCQNNQTILITCSPLSPVVALHQETLKKITQKPLKKTRAQLLSS